MDVNDLRSVVTVAGLVLFLLLVWHTWRRSALPDHEAAAQLPFIGDSPETPKEGVRGE
jgi:cytochrome c oxidase cbb3-type subunit 4